ncbi:MAG: hypothetical protein ABJ256_00655 [Nisaea sp.]|uniref:hypothetical protein n=1 Tax=Alphaproteobacteria TaxID=28211 RepID=UPI003263B185
MRAARRGGEGRNEEEDGEAVAAAAGSARTYPGTDLGRCLRAAEKAALNAAAKDERIDRLVDRVTAGVGVVFEEDDDLGVLDFVGGEDAVLVVGLEEDDWGHEGAGEVPGVFLGEGKIVLHLRAPSLERANPALDGSVSVRISGRDHRAGQSQAAAACERTLHGLIVEVRAAPGMPSLKERVWVASEIESRPCAV